MIYDLMFCLHSLSMLIIYLRKARFFFYGSSQKFVDKNFEQPPCCWTSDTVMGSTLNWKKDINTYYGTEGNMRVVSLHFLGWPHQLCCGKNSLFDILEGMLGDRIIFVSFFIWSESRWRNCAILFQCLEWQLSSNYLNVEKVHEEERLKDWNKIGPFHSQAAGFLLNTV